MLGLEGRNVVAQATVSPGCEAEVPPRATKGVWVEENTNVFFIFMQATTIFPSTRRPTKRKLIEEQTYVYCLHDEFQEVNQQRQYK